MTPSAGIVVADRYRLDRPLGQGGMGAVWVAYHVGLHIPCAVKFIHAQAAAVPEVRARFEREAVAAAQLRSPNVVQILDHGIWEGMPYIAMEMLEGEDLHQRLKRLGALPPAEVLRIVGQIARALTKAHAAGLVHRDLKPANVFLVRDDDQEIAKVLDFGIAKVDAGLGVDGQTKTGSLLGTPYYMSPEQAQGAKNLDHRSDLWALGVLTFQCLTGTLPFNADALGELFMRIMVRPIPVPSQIAPVPAGFDAWWLRAASREPAGRFQTARELSDALGLALGLTGTMPSVVARVGAIPHVPGFTTPGPLTPGPLTPGRPSGISGPVTPAGTIYVSSEQPPARPPRGGLLAMAGVAVAAVVAGGAFFAWRASTSSTAGVRPAAAVDAASPSSAPAPSVAPAPVTTAEAASTPETPAPAVRDAGVKPPATTTLARPAPPSNAAAPAAVAKPPPGARPAGAPRDLGF